MYTVMNTCGLELSMIFIQTGKYNKQVGTHWVQYYFPEEN